MKKNKLYLILALIISIILFATASLCDQCLALGTQTADDDKQGTADEEAEDEETEEEPPPGVEEEAEDIEEETEEPGEEEEVTEDGEEQGEEEETQTAFEEPTVELQIYEGPLYSPGDDVCYWRVQAIVTGVPTPTVEFNRDDSNGAWGSRKAQVNLANPTDSYSLKATATNSEGSVTDSIVLSWECNRPPEITDIVIMGDHFIGVTYTVSVSAGDPDADTLTYAWSVSGGTLSSTTGGVVDWTMPGTVGDYQVTVEADDGNGGTDIMTETIEVTSGLGPPIAAMAVPEVMSEGGSIHGNGMITVGLNPAVGDLHLNVATKGYISFDITGLSGSTVENATLKMQLATQSGDPSGFLPLWIGAVNWGTGTIHHDDFNIAVSPIQNVTAANFMTSAAKLKLYLQDAIDGGRDRFQIMLFFTGMATDNDGFSDYWSYNDATIELFVEYTP